METIHTKIEIPTEKSKEELELERLQRKYQRIKEINIARMKIKQFQRDIEFKQKQIENGKSLEKHDGYLDGAKPIFYLQNEIDQLMFHLQENKSRIRNLKKEQKKDV